MTVELFKHEMAQAMNAYRSYVVCIDKTPDEFEASLISLVTKSIRAYESRGPMLRHGIALDRHVTVILSQSDDVSPLCGIYFNLHSPYHKQPLPRIVQPASEPLEESHHSQGNC